MESIFSTQTRRGALCLTLGGVAACAMKSNTVSFAEVFECFVKTVQRNFYDADAVEKTFNPLVSAYRTKVGSAQNSFELYWNVFSPMLQRFGVSHTSVSPSK